MASKRTMFSLFAAVALVAAGVLVSADDATDHGSKNIAFQPSSGNDPTENGAQLAAAMKSLAEQGGGTITLPDRRVEVQPPKHDNRLDVPGGVSLEGTGEKSEIALVPYRPWTELFHFSQGNSRISSVRLTRTGIAYGRMLTFQDGADYALDRVTIDTGHDRWPDNDFSAIQVSPTLGEQVSRLAIRDSTIQNSHYGLVEPSEATGVVDGITVERCTFQNNHADDLEFNAPAGTGRNVRVSDSTFRDNAAPGPGAGFAIGVANYQQVQIRNNTFASHPMNTIHLEDQTGWVTIEGNTFTKASTKDTGFASAIVVLSGTHDVSINNNEFDLSQQDNKAVPVVIGPGGENEINPWNIAVDNNHAVLRGRNDFVTNYGSSNLSNKENTHTEP